MRASAVDAALRQLASRIAEATAEAAQARRAEGKLEFHDLLVLARDLLTGAGHGAAVRDALHQQYRRLLLDEFQDTDPIQIELAVRIAAGRAGGAADWADVPVPPGRLFLVGDPKQSIYRFRRADIATYLRAQQRIGDQVILAANFRATEPVLAWINHVFGQLISAEDRIPARLPTAAGMPARHARRPGRGGARGRHPPRQAVRRRTARLRGSRRGQRRAHCHRRTVAGRRSAPPGRRANRAVLAGCPAERHSHPGARPHDPAVPGKRPGRRGHPLPRGGQLTGVPDPRGPRPADGRPGGRRSQRLPRPGHRAAIPPVRLRR